jgi:hypothetical protein
MQSRAQALAVPGTAPSADVGESNRAAPDQVTGRTFVVALCRVKALVGLV